MGRNRKGAALEMDETALRAFLRTEFAAVADDFTLLSSQPETLRLRLNPGPQHVRPGGTVSGPALFFLADVAFYLAILARIGPAALTVTTGASIDFLRKPAVDLPLVAETRILKLGRVLVVGDVLVRPEAGGEPVARAALTYSRPPARPAP